MKDAHSSAIQGVFRLLSIPVPNLNLNPIPNRNPIPIRNPIRKP